MNVLNELHQFEPFKRLGADGNALLAHGVVRKHAARSAALLYKGQPVSGAYLVLEGRLRVFSVAPNGTEATLHFIEPGETCVLALNCLFNDLLYPAWVQAEVPSAFALIPGAVYRKLFETEPSIQILTVNALTTVVYRLMTELEQVHSSNHKQRLAHFILAHAAADGSLHMTQQHLADHLGTTREVVARLMQDFVARGFLKTQRGLISIRDLFGFRRVVAPDAASFGAEKSSQKMTSAARGKEVPK